MPPSNPKRAPEAPTDMLAWIKSADSMLPPRPEMMYRRPILTVKEGGSIRTIGNS